MARTSISQPGGGGEIKSGPANALKKALLLLLKFSVSGTLLFLVLRRAGFQNVVRAIKGINPALFVAAAGFYLAGSFVSSLRWRLFVDSGLKLRKFFSLYMLGCFFSMFLPGLVGGDAFKGYYLYRETGKMAEAMASIFMERYLGFVALLVMAALAYPVGLPYLKTAALTVPAGHPVHLELAWYLPALFMAFLVFSLVFFRFRLGSRIRLMADFYGYFGLYGRRRIFKGVLLSFGVQALAVGSVYTLSRGLGMDASLPLFFIFVPLIVTFSAIPLSISGIGIREASFVLLFGSVGVPPRTAIALSFAWFLSVAAGSLAGLYEYLKIKRG